MRKVSPTQIARCDDIARLHFKFLQIIFSDQSVISIFPAKRIRCRDWLKNELQEKEQQISRVASRKHRVLSRLEIILSPRVRCRSCTGPVLHFNFFADHFFSAPPFSPKGKGRGTQKGEGYLTHSLDVKCYGRPP